MPDTSVHITYKTETDTIYIHELDNESGKEKMVELDLKGMSDPTKDGMILDCLEGNLWLFKSHVEFYPHSIKRADEMVKFINDKNIYQVVEKHIRTKH